VVRLIHGLDQMLHDPDPFWSTDLFQAITGLKSNLSNRPGHSIIHC
jgi:hypothetical protein